MAYKLYSPTAHLISDDEILAAAEYDIDQEEDAYIPIVIHDMTDQYIEPSSNAYASIWSSN